MFGIIIPMKKEEKKEEEIKRTVNTQTEKRIPVIVYEPMTRMNLKLF